MGKKCELIERKGERIQREEGRSVGTTYIKKKRKDKNERKMKKGKKR
jgi:hypothetical protein